MFGWGYVKDLCIALFRKEQEEKAIKIYYGECLRAISKSVANFGGGSYIEMKLSDILNPKPIERRSAEEIIANIKSKIDKINS